MASCGRSTEPVENRKPGTLYLDHELIISSLNFTAGDGGSNTVMALKQPDAFLLIWTVKAKLRKKQTKKRKKSGKGSVEDYSKYWEDVKEAGRNGHVQDN